MTKTIAWVVGQFSQVGGGERLIQEGLRYYRSQGYRPIVFTWAYDDVVNFDGEYEPPEVILVAENGAGKNASRAISRLKDLPRLHQLLAANKVDLVLVQSEYDVALVYLVTRLLKVPYRFLIFGQNYQFPEDYSKYTFAFRKHLHTIVNSYEGYRQTVSLTAPKISLHDRVAMELLALLRIRAVRGANGLFAFSRQVAWETELLFGRTPTVVKGAFRASDLNAPINSKDALTRYQLEGERYVLSLSRLVGKKRVELIIRAFAASKLENHILVVGGDGPERARLQELARSLGLDRRVRFLGRVPNELIAGLKQAADLFVSMDIGDYDLSPLEALALGTPILVPEEFEADEALRLTPGVVICEATVNDVSREMERLAGGRAQPSPQFLARYTWEQYFSVLAQ